MRRRNNQYEAAIQRAVFLHLRTRGMPGVVAFHVANGGLRNVREAAILKGCGVTPGVSDIIALHEGKFFALELKSEGCRPTESQLAFIAQVNDAGGYATWAEGLDRALNILTVWGLLKPNVNAQTRAAA